MPVEASGAPLRPDNAYVFVNTWAECEAIISQHKKEVGVEYNVYSKDRNFGRDDWKKNVGKCRVHWCLRRRKEDGQNQDSTRKTVIIDGDGVPFLYLGEKVHMCEYSFCCYCN
ncbi:PREDICTED: uncharacterized protein LOC106818808 [Priapulus caudatus]|uniref:Uncharacterized protein LOC106818808 n=1 Tax=Priapulus caudatus TaxID=37621 RepID=A0ABM1F3E6_PRICU|nr:PREDICTED: uncharacterized protein LOC106818808 [Priapulus caudatus]